jgi:hypothetical protein
MPRADEAAAAEPTKQEAAKQVVTFGVVALGLRSISLQLLLSQEPGGLIDDGRDLHGDPLLSRTRGTTPEATAPHLSEPLHPCLSWRVGSGLVIISASIIKRAS